MIILSGNWQDQYSHHTKRALIIKQHPLMSNGQVQVLARLLKYSDLDYNTKRLAPPTHSLGLFIDSEDNQLTEAINHWIADSELNCSGIHHCHLVKTPIGKTINKPADAISYYDHLNDWFNKPSATPQEEILSHEEAVTWLKSHAIPEHQCHDLINQCAKPISLVNLIRSYQDHSQKEKTTSTRQVLTISYHLHHCKWKQMDTSLQHHSSILTNQSQQISEVIDLSMSQSQLITPLSATCTSQHKSNPIDQQTIHFSQASGIPLCQGQIGPANQLMVTDFSVPVKRQPQSNDLVIIVGSNVHRQHPQHRSQDHHYHQRDHNPMQLAEMIKMMRMYLEHNPYALSGVISHQQGTLIERALHWIKKTSKGLDIKPHNIPNHSQNDWSAKIWQTGQNQILITLPQQHLASWLLLCNQNNCPYAIIGQVINTPKLMISGQTINPQKNNTLKKKTVETALPARKGRKIKCPPIATQKQWLKEVLKHPEVSDKRFLLNHIDITGYRRLVQGPACAPSNLPINNYKVIKYSPHEYSISSCGHATSQAIDKTTIQQSWLEAVTNILGAVCSEQLLSAHVSITRSVKERRYDSAIYTLIRQLANSTQIEATVDIHDHDVFSSTVALHAQTTSQPTIKPIITAPHEFVYWLPMCDLKGLSQSIVTEVCPSLCRDRLNNPHTTNIYKIINCMHQAAHSNLISSLHDISRGGLLTTLLESCWGSGYGMQIDVSTTTELGHFLWHEGPGVIVTVKENQQESFEKHCHNYKCPYTLIGFTQHYQFIQVRQATKTLWQLSLSEYLRLWQTDDLSRKHIDLIKWSNRPERPRIHRSVMVKPLRVLILTDRGTYGHELVAQNCLEHSLTPVIFSVNDLIRKSTLISDFQAIIIPGGATHGDITKPGWFSATQIAENKDLAKDLMKWFREPDTLMLGFGNGAQIISHLGHLHPDKNSWPTFRQNQTKKYEARPIRITLNTDASVLLQPWKDQEIVTSIKGHYLNSPIHLTNNPLASSHEQVNWVGKEQQSFGFWSDNGRVGALLIQPDDTQYSDQMLSLYDSLREWLIAHPRPPLRF